MKTTSPHDSWKIGAAVAAPLILILILFSWWIGPTNVDACVTNAILFGSIAVGWAFGMMLSPDSQVEQNKFLAVWKGVSLFLSGYVVSKIDPVVTKILSPEMILSGNGDLSSYRIASSFATILLMTILVYLVRVYAFTVGDEDTEAANGVGPNSSDKGGSGSAENPS